MLLPDVSQMEYLIGELLTKSFVEYFSKFVGTYVCKGTKVFINYRGDEDPMMINDRKQ